MSRAERKKLGVAARKNRVPERRGQPQPPGENFVMQTANQTTNGAANAEGSGCWSAPIC